jgi:alkaline phosphatase D
LIALAALAPLGGVEAQGQPSAAGLASYPATLDATHDSVLVWVRGTGPATLRVEYAADPATGPFSEGPAATLDGRADFCTTLPLGALTPGTSWVYRIVDADSGAALFEGGRFRTAPVRSVPFTFAFSADMGEDYQPFRLFDLIGSKEPDFFLHLGDTVYADHPKKEFRPSIPHYRYKHARNRRDIHLQQFMSRVVTYAVWDDHETENDAHGANPAMDMALQVYREYWPCRAVDPGTLYRQFTWAGVDFFILDARRFRSDQEMPDGPGKTMLGAAQKAWLKERLKASVSPFKFILTSVPFHGTNLDSWGGYVTERDEIVRFIKSEKITGTVLLSADHHMARDWSSEATGLPEYGAGPIASFTQFEMNPKARAGYHRSRKFYYGDGYNFALCRVDPAARKASIEFIGAKGESLYRAELQA